ncbi:MAG: DUF3368 domain-containing protein [Desulfurococcales archaeon]|nr:DUF3368 domain-containing protein [Desulfurococcales archaeon]
MQRASREKRKASTAVSDTSPLIAVKHAGLLEKLGFLFHVIIVPPSVLRELSVKEEDQFKGLSFLSMEEPHDRRIVGVLNTIVDEGEAEAIALALEKGSLLIIDDLKGRKLAGKLGLKIIGTLGLLKTMKLKGIIKEVKPAIEKLEEEGFYLSKDLIDTLVSDVKEK